MRILQYMEVLNKTEKELTELIQHGKHTERTENIQHWDYLTKRIAHYKSLIENYGKGTVLEVNTTEGRMYLINVTREEAAVLFAIQKVYTIISAQEIPAGLILS